MGIFLCHAPKEMRGIYVLSYLDTKIREMMTAISLPSGASEEEVTIGFFPSANAQQNVVSTHIHGSQCTDVTQHRHLKHLA